MSRRVVITGVGSVNPSFIGGAQALEAWLAAPGPRKAAGSCEGLTSEVLAGLIDETERRRLSRVCQLAVAAGRLALQDAGREAGDEVGLVLGSEFGDLSSTIAFADGYLATGPAGVSALLFPSTVMNTMAATTTIAVSARALSLTLNAPTIAGELAVAQAASAVAAGRAEAMLAGGVDEVGPWLRPTPGAVSVPEAWSEGATYLVLESLEAARARGARLLGEIQAAAWGTLPARPHGVGRSSASTVVAAALREARVASPGWVYASLSGDEPRAAWEQAVLAQALGAQRPPTLALRPLLGQHAGAGPLTVAAAAWTARTGRLPAGAGEAAAPSRVTPGPGLVHALARGGDHAALAVGA
jgi:3-oxoacyl-[acyl-carrier-protein] synthase II